MQELFQLIGSYGFPIVCCIFLLLDRSKKEEEQTKQNAEMQARHEETLNEMRKVITDNTVATNNLATLITHFINKGEGV